MRNKSTVILVVLLVVLIAGAGILYKTLGSRYAPDQLAVEETPVPAETAAPQATPATTETAADRAGFHSLRCRRQRRESFGLFRQAAGAELLGQLVRPLQE